MRHPLLPTTAVALVALGLLGSLAACDKGKGGVQLPASATPPHAAADARPAVASPEGGSAPGLSPPRPAAAPPAGLTVTGTTQAHRSSTLRSKVIGLVKRVHVLDGQAVKAGELLVELDTSDLELRQAAARAALRFAQAQQRAVRLEADRAGRLVADAALPKAQQEQAKAQLDVATAGVAQARVAIQMAAKALEDAQIKAPYDSVIVMRHVAEGDYASAMPPQPIVTLQEIDPIDVRLIIPAVHQGAFHAGDAVKVRFPHTDVERAGTIDRIVPAIDPRNRALSAVVVLPNPDHSLLPGMFAEIERLNGASAQGHAADTPAAPEPAGDTPSPSPAPAGDQPTPEGAR